MNRVLMWVPAFTMMLMSLISYIDRNTLAVLAPTICQDTGISDTDYGWVITCFSVAYMIGNPVWGWLLDRFGLRTGMTVAVGFWTAASAAHAFADEFWEFALARALLGFGEGATFPGGLRAVMQTLPPLHRARGVAIAYSGGSLGAIVAPLIVTPINAHWGWQKAFLFTGLIGIAWMLLWQLVAMRSDIRQTHGESLASDLLENQKPTHDRPRLGDPRVYAFVAAYALGAVPLGFILYWSAKYLKLTFDMSQTDLGKVLWIPPFGWEVGYFFWGWMVDRALRKGEPAVHVERRMMLVLTALSLPLAAVPLCALLWQVMLLKFLAMVVAAGFVIVSLSYATRVYSSASSGLVAGLGAGSWGACVAATSPIFGYLFDVGQFATAFLTASLIPVFGLLLWLGLRNPSLPKQ
jgi:ACS family hexuronate transporter-like MFS transporter